MWKKITTTAILTFALGIILTFVTLKYIAKHSNGSVLDLTISVHVIETIVNAEQIRRGNSDEVLTRLDAWLQGSEIEESVSTTMVETDRRERTLQAIRDYREKYEPME